MKLVKLAPAVFLAVTAIAAIPDFAEAQQPGKPGTIATTGPTATAKPPGSRFVLTVIRGEIAVPPLSSFATSHPTMADFKCSNLAITASSKATIPRPAGHDSLWFDPPVWTRSDVASGSWASGKCSYSISVPGGEPFRLTAGAHNTNGYECHYISVPLTKTPSWQTVPKATSKTDNVTVDYVLCGIIP